MTTAPKIINELVEQFERNLPAYKSTDYKEEQLKNEFLNPFFEALGWDVQNKSQTAPQYRDVIFEDSIKIAGGTKAPDYCFTLAGRKMFFVEAKKPSVHIKKDIHPAYQIRRYAWSAKLPLSILTDFEEFAVYESRKRPLKEDKASTERIMYFTFRDYIDKWDEISSIFSKKAVLQGSFDRFIESTKKKRGTQEVDDEFLKEIERWRLLLARNIAIRNPNLFDRYMNYSVQLTIDRLLFLRMCEDRGIEKYGQLKSLLDKNNIYDELCKIYMKADEKYNSGLFHFKEEKERATLADGLTLNIKIDNRVLSDIVKHLYYPDSPYEFSVLPSEILGNVYEQFLGKVIRLTEGHRAKIEEKPEVKKAGGVYYTPKYIVDYIVENTVGKLCKGKKPKEISKFRILDPACGSGSFLLGAYTYLLKYHLDYYSKQKNLKRYKEQIYQGRGEEWFLTIKEKKRILLNNIYGVDIDPQAVEVTKLSLLLKVLEGESRDVFEKQQKLWRERALPDLGNNIKCGNSLIGCDYIDSKLISNMQEIRQVNPFNWKEEYSEVFTSGGFDVVIGNPPYDVLEKERGASSWPHSALRNYVKTQPVYSQALGGKLNLFRFFLVQSLNLIRFNGRFGMIVPLATLADISCAKTRYHLITSLKELKADCFPQKDNPNKRVFRGAKLSTVILTGMKSPGITEDSAKIHIRVYPWNSFNDPFRENTVDLTDTTLIDPKNTPIPLVDEKDWVICRKLHLSKNTTRLGEMKHFFLVRRGEINQTIYRKYITDNQNMSCLLKGVEIGRYRLREKLSQGIREWFDEESFLKENNKKPIVKNKRIATQRITGVDEKLRIVATLIDPTMYFADSTNSISFNQESDYRIEYLLGLLNSMLFQWRFKITSTNNNVGTNELESLPIRTIDFSNTTDKIHHDEMVKKVERMFELYRELIKAKPPNEKQIIQRQIDATDKQIDALVYELYGLTEEEIRIVEE